MFNLVGSCWAIHTRDYRIHDPQKCQILVTVPEMLAIMLLSPPLARVWTPRIKRWVCMPNYKSKDPTNSTGSFLMRFIQSGSMKVDLSGNKSCFWHHVLSCTFKLHVDFLHE